MEPPPAPAVGRCPPNFRTRFTRHLRRNSFAKLAPLQGLLSLLMLLSGGHAAFKATCISALLVFAGAAHAADPASPDDNAIALDQTVQALKDEMVNFSRDAQAAQNAMLFPPQKRMTVYVSNAIPDLLMQEITITVDDNSPVTYRYSEIDAHALLEKRALQRLVQLNVDRGSHRVHADFVGRYADADEDEGPVSGSFDGTIEKSVEPAEIELQIQRGSRGNPLGMKLRDWKVAAE
ncbi:MAG: hypothetical protein ACT4P0_10950 [Panacagrimonas sp.]